MHFDVMSRAAEFVVWLFAGALCLPIKPKLCLLLERVEAHQLEGRNITVETTTGTSLVVRHRPARTGFGAVTADGQVQLDNDALLSGASEPRRLRRGSETEANFCVR